MGLFLLIGVVVLMYRYAEAHSKEGIEWAILVGVVWMVISFGFSFFLGWGPKRYFENDLTAKVYGYFFSLVGAAIVFFVYNQKQKKKQID